MRVAFLVTDTPHHTYTVWRTAERAEVSMVVIDKLPPLPSFETAHPYEEERDEYERSVLLRECPESIGGFGPSIESPINEPRALESLTSARPDLVIDLGTGIIRAGLIEAFGDRLLTAHAGNPEEYRGIDALEWAVYNRAFEKLAISLLGVDPHLDAGPIVGMAGIEPQPGARLHELRSLSAIATADLVGSALATLAELDHLPTRRQVREGRYYSWMPSGLKGECVRLFEKRYAAG